MIQGEKVQYELSLKDTLSQTINAADVNVNKFESSLGRVKSMAGQVAGVVGAAFGVFASFQFLSESVTMFNESEQAAAQLNATIESTKNIAQLNTEAIKAQAEALMEKSLFDDDAIIKSNALLATFTNIRGVIYSDAIPAIVDMATKMGGDLEGATIQVGKALNDPIQGLTALRRVGVSFSDAQRDVIKNLVETNRTAEAQALILKELQTEFGGSAAAAAEAGTGPFTVLQNQFGNVREEIGGLLVDLGISLMPVFYGFVDLVRDAVTWIKENTDTLKTLAGAVGIAAAAYTAYKLILLGGIAVTQLSVLWQGIQLVSINVLGDGFLTASFGAKILAAAQWALNAAWEANPIGIVIAAIAAVTAAVIYCYNHFATFRAILWSVWEVIKEWASLVIDAFQGVWHVIHGIFTLDADEIKLGSQQQLDVMYNAGQRLGDAAKRGYQAGLADFKIENKESVMPSPAAKTAISKVPTPIAPIKSPKQEGKASPAKTVNIRIEIKELIHELNIKTTNLKEGVSKAKDMVAAALISAVNDSQIIAGE